MTEEHQFGDVSATIPDWSREECALFEWHPSRRLLNTVRKYKKCSNNRGVRASITRKLLVVQHRFWSIVTGADIPLNSDIDGGLLLPHPNGIVIHPSSKVGPNCLFFQQVTLGTGGKKPGCPHLEGHVDIGAGAKILGGIHIGSHVRIGANAVVVDDVPSGATVVGVPAKPVHTPNKSEVKP